jgi:protein-disulfide isomerase
MNIKQTVALLASILVLLPALGATAAAEMVWKVQQTLALEHAPKDMAVALDGKWLYLLTDDDKLLVYTSTGELAQKIPLQAGIDRIQSSPEPDLLYLISQKNKSIQLWSLDVIQNIHISDSPFKGPEKAPVVIAVFTDFQCSFCAQLVPLLDQVLEQYPTQVKLVYKNFPLSGHSFAIKAALAALAARSQGKFWQFHDLLFQNHDKLDDAKVEEIRSQLGLDGAEFQKQLKSSQAVSLIRADYREGSEVGVRGTPTVFINGKIQRDKSLPAFQEEIENQLKKLKVSSSPS